MEKDEQVEKQTENNREEIEKDIKEIKRLIAEKEESDKEFIIMCDEGIESLKEISKEIKVLINKYKLKSNLHDDVLKE